MASQLVESEGTSSTRMLPTFYTNFNGWRRHTARIRDAQVRSWRGEISLVSTWTELAPIYGMYSRRDGYLLERDTHTWDCKGENFVAMSGYVWWP